MKNKKSLLVLITILAVGVGCGRNSSSSGDSEAVEDSTQNTAEQVYSMVGSMAGSTETGSTGIGSKSTDEMESLKPQAVCSSSNRSCTGANCTIAWSGCTLGTSNEITMTGGWSEAFSSNSCATTAFTTGCSVTRTTASGGSVATFTSGANFTATSDSHQTYDGTTVSGGQSISNSAGTRSFTVNGIRRVLKGPRGTTWFDVSITTPTAITVTGSRSGGNRTITGGSLKIYHNRASYTANNSFSSVVWGSSTCCYPTSGSISTTFTGSVTGTSTLTFSSTCGTATFTDTTGSSSITTLKYCQEK